VIEEVLRIHGFDRVPLPKRMAITLDVVDGPDMERERLRMSELLVGRGFAEIMNNSLTKASDAVTFLEQSGREEKALDVERFVEMLNPLSSDLAVMRQTLLFQGLETIARNRNVQRPDLRLFELGRTYKKGGEGEGFEEREMLGVWMTGAAFGENWNRDGRDVGFWDLKGEVGALLGALGVAGGLVEVPAADGYLLEGLQLETMSRGERGRWVPSGEVVGRLGRVHPDATAVKGLEGVEVFYAEFEVAKLVAMVEERKVRVADLAKFPAVRRDLSLLVPVGVTFGQLADCVGAAGGKLVKRVGLFDVYTGDGLPEGMQSYAINIVLQDETKTLNDKIIDKAMGRILQQLEQETGARLRQQQTQGADA
jgi:phenylalanyl-tRNA synthetase beta chain